MTLRAGSRLLEWVPRLRRYARALVRHPQDADDLVQDTLERAWTKSGHWSSVCDMRAWLFSLMHNVHVDNLRRPSPDTVDISDEVMLSVAVNPSHDGALHIRDLEWALSQLPVEQREVHAYLQHHPEQAAKVQAWRDQRSALRHHFSGIMDDPIPSRLQQAALRPPQSSRGWARIAAGLVAGVLCALAGWMVRDHQLGQSSVEQVVGVTGQDFATRAAVAHAVYVPDQRRPVEIDAAHQDQLVTWLSKRMGAPMNPPDLRSLGYELEDGRLLPGGRGPWPSSCMRILPECD